MQAKLICPACGDDAKIPAVQMVGAAKAFERYHCPTCDSHMLTEDLLVKRIYTAGRPGRGGRAAVHLPFDFGTITNVASGSFYDLTQSTTVLESGTFSVGANETVIVCVGSDGCNALESSVKIGTTSGTLAAGLTSAISLNASIWYITGVTNSAAKVRVDWAADPPVTAAVTVSKMTGSLVSPIDRTSTNATAHEQFDTAASSGATSTLTSSNQLAIANIVGLIQNTDTPLVWGSGFTGAQSKGTASNPTFDIVVHEGRKTLSNNSAVTASGTLPYDTAWTACVATFLHG